MYQLAETEEHGSLGGPFILQACFNPGFSLADRRGLEAGVGVGGCISLAGCVGSCGGGADFLLADAAPRLGLAFAGRRRSRHRGY